MAGPFDFPGYGSASGQGGPDLGGLFSFLTPSGMPTAQSSLNLAAALGGLPLSSPPQGYEMSTVQQPSSPYPATPDPWAGARPMSASDLGLLPMQRPAPAAVPSAPLATAENFGWLGLPGAPGLSPYDASAAPPVTAENFGWQGLAQALGIASAPFPAPALPMGTGLFPGVSTPPSVAMSGVSAGDNSTTAGPSSSLAVIFGGNRGGSGNPLGHIAIALEGHGVYSFGTKTPLASSATDYVNSQKTQRDVTVVTIPTTPEQSKAALDYLQQYNDPEGIDKFDNCANRTGTALMRAGILPDPELLTFPPFPSNVLFQARSAAGASETYIPRNGSPPELSRFDPRP
jgi:hypothetical protein